MLKHIHLPDICVFFTGKDASRAFITGDFTEAGLSNDVSDFSESQIVALYDWLSFYQRDYTAVGGYHIWSF